MKRLIRSRGVQGEIAWNEKRAGEVEFSLAFGKRAGETRAADVLEVEPGVYSVLIEGRSYEVKITPTQASWAVDVDGRHFVMECADPRTARQLAPGGASTGPMRLSSPMPGKVIRVLVDQGQPVEPGQGVAIVEAMKMQNEVRAPRAGRMLSILAAPGATVAAGETLAILE